VGISATLLKVHKASDCNTLRSDPNGPTDETGNRPSHLVNEPETLHIPTILYDTLLVVTNDLPTTLPITREEIELLYRAIGSLLDELFSP
jgi:hypothetical protein